MNLFTKQKHTDLENELMVTRGEGIDRGFGTDMYTLLYLKWITGTSLAVQWLRLHASIAGGIGSIPGQGTTACHAA